MNDLIRRSRGMGVALVVLAMSAGVVFAGAPHFAAVASNEPLVAAPSVQAGESEAPESEAPESEAPESEAPESEEPSETASEEASDDASGQAKADDVESASGNTHGALVSTAAHMPTPDGFPNHGAFVSCVAHMDKGVAVDGFDWTTVTPEACGLAATDATARTSVRGNAKADAGKAKGQAGKAKGQAAKAKGKGHGGD